jgi:formate dehydrogenase iron-sulfur subunit
VNDGVARLRELAAQELVCRRCERRSCLEACPNEALEERPDGTLRRWNMRCTGCLSCGHACPFGVIVPAALQFRDGACDACAGREVREPLCISTCPLGAIKMEDADAGSADVHVLSDRLGVRSKLWQKLEPVQRP